MKPHKLLLLALAGAWTLGATAQYQWLDKEGRTVFSDRAPPIEIPQKNILQAPRALTAPRAAPAPAPATGATDAGTSAQAQGTSTDAATSASPAPVASGADKQLEERKAKAEAAEEAKKKAEEKTKTEQQAKARADNCARARKTAAALQPGRLVATTNAAGERGYMDDASRAAELRRAEQIISTDCK